MNYLEHVNMNVTKDIKNYVKNEVMQYDEILVLDKGEGYCTRCNFEGVKSNKGHNEYTNCPLCGARIKVKLKRYGRKSIWSRKLIYVFEKSKKDNKGIVIKAYMIMRSGYENYKNVKTDYILKALYIFSEEGNKMYENGPYGTVERTSIFDINNIISGPFNGGFETWIDIRGFEKAIKGTKFEYCEANKVISEFGFGKMDKFLKYLELYNKNQMIESLIKIGFIKLITERVENGTQYYACNWRGKTIYKILKLNKADVRELVKNKVDITAGELKLLQMVKKQKGKLKIEEIQELAFEFRYRIFTIEKVLEVVKIDKLINYFNKQIEKIEEKKSYANLIITYNDYLEDLKELGLDLKDKKILFPKNLEEEHLRVNKQVALKLDKVLSKKIQNRKRSLDKYKFIDDGFILRPIRSYKELIREGKSLGHCVANYAEKHGNGTTSIFVIRDVENTNKPLYTVEIQNEKIVQVRGKNNCEPSEEVKIFIEKFKKEKLENKEKDKKIIKIA